MSTKRKAEIEYQRMLANRPKPESDHFELWAARIALLAMGAILFMLIMTLGGV